MEILKIRSEEMRIFYLCLLLLAILSCTGNAHALERVVKASVPSDSYHKNLFIGNTIQGNWVGNKNFTVQVGFPLEKLLNNVPNLPPELTLKEAVNLGRAYSKEWNSKSELYLITSTDTEKNEGSKGLKGRRIIWSLVFFVPDTNKQLLIKIKEKNISNSMKVEDRLIKSDEIIKSEEIVIDSPEALNLVKSKYKIKPREDDWARGHHFMLRKENNESIIYVSGLINGEFREVGVNSKSGNMN
jgi:hypothetical protein